MFIQRELTVLLSFHHFQTLSSQSSLLLLLAIVAVYQIHPCVLLYCFFFNNILSFVILSVSVLRGPVFVAISMIGGSIKHKPLLGFKLQSLCLLVIERCSNYVLYKCRGLKTL